MTTDDELMLAVWSDPDCPVELADPDSFGEQGRPIDWPRERIEIAPGWPKHEPVYHHLCRRHGQDHPDTRFLLSIVEMPWKLWLINEPNSAIAVRVYLGQCEDCGRIYWALTRP